MKTGIATWQSAPPPLPPQPLAPGTVLIVWEEARRRPLLLAGIFTAVALCALLIGMALPKTYTASTTIQIPGYSAPGSDSKRGIDEPVTDRAALAREMVTSKPVMHEILSSGGWMADKPTPVEQEQLINQIIGRISITSSKQLPHLVQISYTDRIPERALSVTRDLADLVIREGRSNRSRESQAAFEFIDSQVVDYQTRLEASDAKLTEFRRTHPDAREGSSEEVSRRISDLRRALDSARLDVVDAGASAGVLSSQMASESPLGVRQSRSSQDQVRIAELQGERQRLLQNYTPQHPDVVRVQHQIESLTAGLSQAGSSDMTLVVPRGASSGDSGTGALNPLYNQLRGRATEANSRRAASASRVAMAERLLQEEMSRSDRQAATDGALAAMVRDEAINRELYEDLVKNRESARVAMNRSAGTTGLDFHILEPATLPLQPSSRLRLIHVAVAGLLLAAAMPLLVLLGWLRIDPRVRSPAQIEQLAGLPVLGSIPPPRGGPISRQRAQRYRVAAAMVLLVPLSYALVLASRMMGST